MEIVRATAGCDATLIHCDVLPEWAAQTEQGWRDLLHKLDSLLQD